MDYPHLDDTSFPHLDNIDVWKYKNTFDYTRWQPEVRLKLCNVKWPDDYAHTVAFNDDAARDEYFNNLTGHVVELTADNRRVSDTIKVPETYSVCSRYNYCVVESKYPDIAFSEQPRKLFYFINGIRWMSPNATELELQLDVWTTYVNSASIQQVYLDRGHAPMDRTDASSYLQNPITHTDGLLTPDVNYGEGAEVVRDYSAARYDGDKYVCLALPIAYGSFDNAVKEVGHTSYSAPTFANTSDRHGYQFQVNGYGWTDTELGDTNLSSHPLINPGAAFVPSTARIYAVPAKQLFSNNGWRTLQTFYPYLIDVLQACFIVPENLITLGTKHTKSGLDFYEIAFQKVTRAVEYDLSTEAFGYDSKYRDIAKLYTYPYAWLEVSTDAGQKVQVRIEDISGSKLVIHSFLNLTLPFLDWTIAATNAGAGGINTVQVANLSGNTSDGTEFNSDFTRYLLDMGIPTYSVYLSGEDAYKLRQAGNVEAQRNNALVNYRNSVRSTNTGHENTVDGNATMVTNTSAANATMVTNTANNGATATRNTALSVAASTSNTEDANFASTNNTDLANTMIALGGFIDEALQHTTIDINRDAMTSTNTNNMLGSAASSIGSGLASGVTSAAQAGITSAASGAAAGAAAGAVVGPAGIIAGAAIGGIATAAAGLINSAVANQNSVISFNASADIAQATISNNQGHRSLNQAQASLVTGMNTNTQTKITDTNNALATNSNANNVSNANTNANNSAATNNANTNRSATTGNNNSRYSRNASVSNAQDSLRAAQYAHQKAITQSRAAAPVPNGPTSGDPRADAYGRRIIAVRAKTQSDNAIRRAGDYFTRYGYAYNGLWDINTWVTAGKRFNYWRATDAVMSGEINAGVRDTLLAILARGVTVWNDPSMEGGYYER